MNTVILGGGAIGLSLAYLMARRGERPVVLEAGPRAGGLLGTFDAGGGQQLEHYYHHFFTHDAEINWLLGELGLADRVIYRPTTMGVHRKGKTYAFDGLKDLLRFKAMPLWARLRFGMSSAQLAYLSKYSEREDESAMAWFHRHAGADATNAIWAPLLRIKFGDDADKVPLAWMAGRLRQRARSRKGASEQLGYLQGSLQAMVDRLTQEIVRLGGEVRTSIKVLAIQEKDGTACGVNTTGGPVVADRIVSTIPTPILAELVRPVHAGYADSLAQIEYFGAICTVLAVRRPLSPVYWLNVADPGYDFGGVIEQTNFIDPKEYGGRHVVYLSRYLRTTDPLWAMDDSVLLNRQLEQTRRLFDADLTAPGELIDRWIFRARYAAPVTDLGFSKRIPKYVSPVPGLFVAAMPHIYPDERSVNNSIRVAAAAMGAMGLDASDVPMGASLSARFGH